jgi:hypothetical protein
MHYWPFSWLYSRVVFDFVVYFESFARSFRIFCSDVVLL